MSKIRPIVVLLAVFITTAASAQTYDYYFPASTGDGSLMIVVWDVSTGATLVDRVAGYSMNDIASQPFVFFQDGLPANADDEEIFLGNRQHSVAMEDGRRWPWPFSVGQKLSNWNEFVRLSSGNPDNYRFSVSAADNNNDGADNNQVYKALAFTANANDLEMLPNINSRDIGAGAAALDEFFNSPAGVGRINDLQSEPFWDDAFAAKIDEATNFWIAGSGWSNLRGNEAVKIENYPHQWTLGADGCLRFNAQSCNPISAPAYITEEWPKALPNDWDLGWVSDVAVDSDNHIWVLQRPTVFSNQTNDNPDGIPIPTHNPAPAVLEFNQAGDVIRAWGGQAWDAESQTWYPTIDGWPFNYEHGIYIDADDNVWITWALEQHYLMKFTPDGEPLLSIGSVGETGGSDNTDLLGGPADVVVDDAAQEVFVADGYINRRIIVFDSETGEYKRHWGVYGNPATDGPRDQPNERFVGAIHGITLANDGLLYVLDREGNRVQVFEKDGTFVSEITNTPAFDIALSPDRANQLLYLGLGGNFRASQMLGGGLYMLDRREPGVAAYFAEGGITRLHGLAVDLTGNVYTAELRFGISKQAIRPN